jgi:hypothetical protein
MVRDLELSPRYKQSVEAATSTLQEAIDTLEKPRKEEEHKTLMADTRQSRWSFFNWFLAKGNPAKILMADTRQSRWSFFNWFLAKGNPAKI